MSDRTRLEEIHSYLPKLAQDFTEKKFGRREFLRTATLLGLSASAAYAIAGLPNPMNQPPGLLRPAARFACRCACSRSKARTPIRGSRTP